MEAVLHRGRTVALIAFGLPIGLFAGYIAWLVVPEIVRVVVPEVVKSVMGA